MQYEVLFLIGQDQESNVSDIEKNVDTIIIEAGGTLLDERWENKRKLAYPIQHSIRGTYVAKRFVMQDSSDNVSSEELKYSAIETINKKLLLLEGILRFIIVRSEDMLTLKEFATRKEEEKIHAKKPFEKTERVPELRQPPVRIKRTAQKIERTPTQEETTPIQKTTESEQIDILKEEPSIIVASKDISETKPPKSEKKKTVRSAKKASLKEIDEKDKTSEADIDKKLDEILNM